MCDKQNILKSRIFQSRYSFFFLLFFKYLVVKSDSFEVLGRVQMRATMEGLHSSLVQRSKSLLLGGQPWDYTVV